VGIQARGEVKLEGKGTRDDLQTSHEECEEDSDFSPLANHQLTQTAQRQHQDRNITKYMR